MAWKLGRAADREPSRHRADVVTGKTARRRVPIRRARPPLSTNDGFGRRAHAWRRCSWAMSSDISLSTSSRGLSPGWDLIIAAILLLLRPLSTSDSAQSASAVTSMRIMAATSPTAKCNSTVKNAADFTPSRGAELLRWRRERSPDASESVRVLFYPSPGYQKAAGEPG